MRQLADRERIARDVAKSSSDVPYLADDLEHYIFDMGFTAGLDFQQAKIDKLENSVDTLLKFVNGKITRQELEEALR